MNNEKKQILLDNDISIDKMITIVDESLIDETT